MTDFFDCKGIAEIYKKQLVQDFKALNYVPTLLTILTNDSKPCVQYAKAIDKHCSTFGVLHKNIKATDTNSLMQLITHANKDVNIQGIFLFSPVHFPDIRDEELMDLIAPMKDIEGLHSLNLGYLEKFRVYLENDLKCVVPCTPKAIIKLMDYYNLPISGKQVAIINDSYRIGRPLRSMLGNLRATVTTCHDKTQNIGEIVKMADIVVTAVPLKQFKVSNTYKKGAIVIDASYGHDNLGMDSLDNNIKIVTTPQNPLAILTTTMLFMNLYYVSRYKGRLY